MHSHPALINLYAVAEEYPELKANENFLSLQNELSDVESDIEKSRRYYNGTTRDYNIVIDSFPSNIIAGITNFKKAEYFEIDIEAPERNLVNKNLLHSNQMVLYQNSN